ncbi:Tyrosine kinase [Handroanthus impetiginosus]|uniref:non-specific serine/threonine protein kinase n=1 Tax=Handroanthus impetiginosus TaxID=429701 RepID=A0A2G9G1I7_9LAMI|nr:Tyrosine kinase [Handroanthus impetiginosus]
MCTFRTTMSTAMDGGEESQANLYRVLLDRFQSLEASHQKIKEQFKVLSEEKTRNTACKASLEKDVASDSEDMTSFPGWGCLQGAYFFRSPYRSVLEYMGHAVHVCRTGSGEIVYWNSAAKKLFGYKDYEAVGRRVVELIFDEQHLPSALTVMRTVSTGKSWTGQLPLKKRSGQNFMAMVTKTPLYEDGELVGIITVSSDANVFNGTNSGTMRTHQDHTNEQSKVRRINFKKIQWHPDPQIVAVPQLASSVSNLASKVLLWKRGDVTCNACRPTRETEEAEVESQDAKADRPPRAPILNSGFSMFIGRSRTDVMSSEKEGSTSEFVQPSKIAEKLFSKLQIGPISNLAKDKDENIQQNGLEDNPRKDGTSERWYQRDSVESTSHLYDRDANYHPEDAVIGIVDVAEREHLDMHMNTSVTNESSSTGAFSGAYQGCFEVHRPADQMPGSGFQSDRRKSIANLPNITLADSEDVSPRQSGPRETQSTGGSCGNGPGSSPNKGDSDTHLVVDSEIRWEDLHLKEEIGQGSFAVVYRGVWNGSDVAVKVYCGNQYNEDTLLDYKKEIDIMRKLRHPNVLLFMGAVCTEEKLAIVTEYMTRGSLFKTLHRNGQSLDIRRRLRMAIDVARGMNYLHHRNPPIVHRDLKSSNLLVDKSWTVKVGDFGLSKLKDATFLTARSGRGTPQWMAPEVLRNEPSTEKSDVFSFGVILWELMTERIPWSNLNFLEVVGVVGFMDGRLDLPENIDPQVSSLISQCWRSNPEDRPSFEEIIRKMTDIVHAGAGVTVKTPSTP